MLFAHQRFENVITNPGSLGDPYSKREEERAPLVETLEEKTARQKSRFEQLVSGGYIKSRKFIDEVGINLLLEILLPPEYTKTQKSPDKNSKSLKKTERISKNLGTLKMSKDIFKDLRSGKGKAQLQKGAVEALIYYSFPKESVAGTRKKLEALQVLDAMIEFAASGKVVAHQAINPGDFEIGKEIAHGASGKVFLGIFQERKVAIKHCSPHYYGFNAMDVTREIAVISLLRHKNIMKCYGAAIAGSDSYIVSGNHEMDQYNLYHQSVFRSLFKKSFPHFFFRVYSRPNVAAMGRKRDHY